MPAAARPLPSPFTDTLVIAAGLLVCIHAQPLQPFPANGGAADAPGPHVQRVDIERDDTATVRRAVLAALTPRGPTPAADSEVAWLVTSLATSGTWPDIDYADASRSWWFASEHLRRCLLMASVFVSPGSPHRNSTVVRDAADRAFEWWLRTDPQNQWWWMQIGVSPLLLPA